MGRQWIPASVWMLIADATNIYWEAQIKANERGVEEYLQDLSSNNDKIDLFSTSIENILSDSDIVVLQKNYDYLFWSILATGTVVVAMNIVKK